MTMNTIIECNGTCWGLTPKRRSNKLTTIFFCGEEKRLNLNKERERETLMERESVCA